MRGKHIKIKRPRDSVCLILNCRKYSEKLMIAKLTIGINKLIHAIDILTWSGCSAVMCLSTSA